MSSPRKVLGSVDVQPYLCLPWHRNWALSRRLRDQGAASRVTHHGCQMGLGRRVMVTADPQNYYLRQLGLKPALVWKWMIAGTWPLHSMPAAKHFKWHPTIHDRVQALGLATVTAGGADWSRDPLRIAAFFSPKLIAFWGARVDFRMPDRGVTSTLAG